MTEESASSEPATPTEQEPTILLQWVCHPIKSRSVLLTVGLVLFLTILVALTYHWTESTLFAVIAALILWGSVSQYFLPVSFRLTDRTVTVKYTTHKIEKAWNLFRSYYVDRNGVLLSPFGRPSRLETFRGLYVRFAGNKDQVVAVVIEKIQIIEDDI